MADLVLKDRQGVPQTYAGYAKVAFNTPDSGTVIFSEGEATENVPIELDLSAGDQTVEAQSGTLMKSAVIKKPTTLTPENVAKDVNVAGVVGTFIGNGVENVEVIPDFSTGDQTVTAEAGTLIKSAIVRKPETLVPENIAKGINVAGVTGSLSGAMGDYIRFFDFDGTLVDGWSKEILESATELPAYPEHEGLTCQGWNWTLDQLKAENAPMDVGAMYITSDGKTRIYITLSEGRTSPRLGLAVNGSVDVDWGDGTAHDTLTGTSATSATFTQNHAYTAAGDYVITLTITGNANIMGSSSLSYLLNDAYANSIKRIHLGENIGLYSYAFYSCRHLSHITIPFGVQYIESNSFKSCSALAKLIIPSSVEDILGYAFQYCYSLAKIILPYSVRTIGERAFHQCYSLSEIRIPSSVRAIYSEAFYYCYSLSEILIPYGVTSLGSNIFAYCYSLVNAIFQANVVGLGNYIFANCYSLVNVTILTRITSIDSGSFQNCSALAKLIIPSSVVGLSTQAFSNCPALVNVTIPASVRYIYDYAFYYCVALGKLIFESETPPRISGSNAFSNLPTDCVIHVPNDSYLTATNYPSPSTYTYVVGGAS